jgi:hypothetical protein
MTGLQATKELDERPHINKQETEADGRLPASMEADGKLPASMEGDAAARGKGGPMMMLDPESDVFEQEVDRQLSIMMQQLGIRQVSCC